MKTKLSSHFRKPKRRSELWYTAPLIAGLTLVVFPLFTLKIAAIVWLVNLFVDADLQWLTYWKIFGYSVGAGAVLVGFGFLVAHIFDLKDDKEKK